MENNEGKTALGLDLNVGALVCYLNICVPAGLIYSILVLVQDKDNKLPRFHAFQSLLSLVLFVVVYIGWFVVAIVGSLIDAALGVPLVTLLGMLIMALIGLGLLVMVIIAAVKGFSGETYKIPIIGNFADQWSG